MMNEIKTSKAKLNLVEQAVQELYEKLGALGFTFTMIAKDVETGSHLVSSNECLLCALNKLMDYCEEHNIVHDADVAQSMTKH